MKQRAHIFYREHSQILKLLLGFLVFGALYAIFTLLTGIGIPCLFYQTTGLCCPGCGVSRFFLELLQLRIPEALSQNLAVGILLFLWLTVAVIEFLWNPQALRQGSLLNRCLVAGSLILLVTFGLLRNLPGLEWLLPS